MTDKKQPAKIMDVSKPGKSKPSQTSKPVIVGHGSTVKDSTVVSASKKSEKNAEDNISPTVTRKKITPISDDEKADINVKTTPKDETPAIEPTAPELGKAEDKPAEEAAPEESAAALTPEPASSEPEPETPAEAEPAAPEPTPEPTPEPAPEPVEETKPVTSESGAVDALAEQAQDKKMSDKEAEASVAHDAEVSKIIDSKKYFVPIGHDSTKKHSNKTALILLLLILLIAVGAYLALDAGAIKINGVNVPYHLIGTN